MENQMEIPIPAYKPRQVKHLCRDLKNKHTSSKALASKPPAQKLVTVFQSIDPRWMIGKCARCSEVIVRKS